MIFKGIPYKFAVKDVEAEYKKKSNKIHKEHDFARMIYKKRTDILTSAEKGNKFNSKYIKMITQNSLNKNFKESLDEWVFVSSCGELMNAECCCGHKIKEVNIIENKHTKKTLDVGNTHILSLLAEKELKIKKQFEKFSKYFINQYKAIRKFERIKKANIKIINFLNKEGIINKTNTRKLIDKRPLYTENGHSENLIVYLQFIMNIYNEFVCVDKKMSKKKTEQQKKKNIEDYIKHLNKKTILFEIKNHKGFHKHKQPIDRMGLGHIQIFYKNRKKIHDHIKTKQFELKDFINSFLNYNVKNNTYKGLKIKMILMKNPCYFDFILKRKYKFERMDFLRVWEKHKSEIQNRIQKIQHTVVITK